MTMNFEIVARQSTPVRKKVGVLLSTSVFLASTSMLPAAQAHNEMGGGAFRDFKQANPGFENKELRQMFRGQFNPAEQIQSFAQPVGGDIQSSAAGIGSFHHILVDDAGKQEARSAKQALQLELKAAHQNLNKTLQDTGSKTVNANNFSLDLGSAVENITLGNNLFKDTSSVTISVGGQEKTLTAGTKVTAAEYLAAKQVLNAGGQKVALDGNGTAVGGSVDLSALTSGNHTLRVDDLHITENVTAYGDFGKGGDVRINGDLVNAGGIVAYSSDKNINVANLRADNITNAAGANISSGLNADQGGVVENVSLGLYANNNINNYGNIASAGDLTLSAGNTLTNAGSAIAQANVNVQAPEVVNSGAISSIASNINVDSSSASVLNVNNIGGTLSALNGAINLRNADFNGAFDTNITGGDLLSKEVNLNAGQGTANVDVQDLTGVVTATGLAAHVKADTETLVIGKQCLIGDPTYYNTGDIEIAGDITVGEKLAIIAGASIITSQTSLAITANSAGQGFDIQMIAGANITGGTGPGGPISGNPPAGAATGSVTISGGSMVGGVIDLSSATNLTINANSTTAGANGGNVVLAAYNGSLGAPNRGRVLLASTSNINVGAGIGGTNGDVTVVAGGPDGLPVIGLGNINNARNVTISTSAPTYSSGTSMTFDTTGAVTSGNQIIGGNSITPGVTASAGNIGATGNVLIDVGASGTFGDLSANNITAQSYGADLSFGSLNATNNLVLNAASTLNIGGGVSAHNYDITAPTLNLQTVNQLATTLVGGVGGDITLNLGAFSTSSNPLFLFASGTNGGGNITLNFNSANTLNVGQFGGDVYFASASANGAAGEITINAGGDVNLNDFGITNSANNGGKVTVVSQGNLSLNSSTAIRTGPLFGSGADITLLAGSDTTGNLILNDTSNLSQTNANGNNGNGGHLLLDGQAIVVTTSLLNPLTLSAQGSGTGDGGSITYRTRETTALFAGNPSVAPKKGPAMFITADARSGVDGGDGGDIFIQTGGALTVNSELTTAAAQDTSGNWNGASYTFIAGTTAPKGAALVVNGSLNASGNNLGESGIIVLRSSSKNAFVIGNSSKPPKNGINGSLSAVGSFAPTGTIDVRNLGGGGVTVAGQVNGDVVVFQTIGKGAITTPGENAVFANDSLFLISDTGAIGSKNGFQFISPLVTVNSNGSATLSSGDDVRVTGTAGGTFSLFGINQVDVSNLVTGGKFLEIFSAFGQVNVLDNATVTANNGTLTLASLNESTGSIRVGLNSVVETQGTKGGQVLLAVSAKEPKKGTNPATPSNTPMGMTVHTDGKGLVFLGIPGTLNVNGGVTAEALNKNLIFAAAAGTQITLENGSRVTADPPSVVATANSVASSITSATPVALANPPAELFGFDSGDALHTSDLSVLNLNAVNAQTARTISLVTDSSAAFKLSKNGASNALTSKLRGAYTGNDEDDSYMVGYANAIGLTDAAICSDMSLGALQTSGFAKQMRRIQHNTEVNIQNGNVLFVPTVDTVVVTPNGNVKIAAKSVVLVSTSADRLAVYDLEDQHKGSVSIEAGGHSVVLSPGRHALITQHHGAEFAQINAIETVAHRNVSSVLKNGTRAHLSEFSIPTALDTVAPLKAMVLSSHPEAKKIASRMMKTTAVVMQLGGGAGQYHHYFKPRMTAMAK